MYCTVASLWIANSSSTRCVMKMGCASVAATSPLEKKLCKKWSSNHLLQAQKAWHYQWLEWQTAPRFPATNDFCLSTVIVGIMRNNVLKNSFDKDYSIMSDFIQNVCRAFQPHLYRRFSLSRPKCSFPETLRVTFDLIIPCQNIFLHDQEERKPSWLWNTLSDFGSKNMFDALLQFSSTFKVMFFFLEALRSMAGHLIRYCISCETNGEVTLSLHSL